MLNRILLALMLVLPLCAVANAQPQKPLLMQQPTLNAKEIVFAYGGQLWRVSREGGVAVELTSGPGRKSNPKFSPDGRWIAFSSNGAGNRNVYVMPAEGGQPRQLTYDPGPDLVEGWTPDGQNVLFRSPLQSYSPRFEQLFTVPFRGGFEKLVPLPMAYQGSYSPDGTHLAYTPLPRELFFVGLPNFVHAYWSQYHGGLAPKIWIANLADSRVVKIPHTNASDFNPMWVGNKIYFLSARTNPISLFVYDTATKKVSQVLGNHGEDFMSASAGPGAIVYEQFGSLHIYNLKSKREHEIRVTIRGDIPQLQPHFENVGGHVLNAGISPSGARALFEAHGEIITVPARKGNVRNITNSPSVADRSPAWSPNGKWIAYFSDKSGEYALHIKNQDGMGPVRSISLGKPPSFFFDPVWSPDSKKIAYTDKRLNLWYVDLDHPTPVKIATDTYFAFERGLNPAWSPDSRWIVYTKIIGNRMRAVFVYSLETGKSTQISDGMSDAEYAAFDKSGKYLYFTASTNSGPTETPLDMTSLTQPVSRSIYIVVLRKDLPSPLAPQSDEEKTAAAGSQKQKPSDKQTANPAEVRIDFAGIDKRILPLPIPSGNYLGLQAGKPGEIFLSKAPAVAPLFAGESPQSIIKFSLATRSVTPLMSGIKDFHISFDGTKFLYQEGTKWGIAPTATPVKPGQGLLPAESMKVWVVPRQEWKEIYHEVWRIERDFFYASNYAGLDLPAAERHYAAFLPGIVSRQDLNYLFREMLGKLCTGHTFVGGGDIPKVPTLSVGLLGANYTIDHNRYRFAKIYSGENWNPGLNAPLSQPGLNVKVGDYLLAVNGRELHGTDNIYRFFLDTAGKQVVLTVGPSPDGTNSRQITVVPVANEISLRHADWVAHNLRLVNRLSNGKVAYIYLPDTAVGGFTSFNRYFFAQVGKQAAIIDDRFNSGGQAADYIIEYLQRKLWNYWYTPNGAVMTEPGEAIFGPKAMLINQYAGSGGDLIPWFFRHVGLGPLIGERTWGGEVGITGYPPLIDGGMVTAPSLAFFTTEGKWGIENQGNAPDIKVAMDPHAWREGHDPQLAKAVQVVLEKLKAHPLPKPHVPPFPNYYPSH
jgi:tricorn protease